MSWMHGWMAHKTNLLHIVNVTWMDAWMYAWMHACQIETLQNTTKQWMDATHKHGWMHGNLHTLQTNNF